MKRLRSKPTTSEKVGAVLYTQVSDPRQVENTSLELQRQECERLALELGAPVAAAFEERGESAKTTDRTQLQAALKFCIERQKELRYFIAFRVDRLSRQAHDDRVLKQTRPDRDRAARGCRTSRRHPRGEAQRGDASSPRAVRERPTHFPHSEGHDRERSPREVAAPPAAR